jgi:hypothetical protein
MNKSQGQPVAAVKNKALSVKSGLRAGSLTANHNRRPLVA